MAASFIELATRVRRHIANLAEFHTEASLTFTDVTTNDVSTTKHGFMVKAPNDATKFWRGDATYAVLGTSAGSGIPVIYRKTADQTVNNSAVLANDTHLVMAVSANGIYYFRGFLVVTSVSVNSDLKLAFTVPAGATMFWNVRGGQSLLTTEPGFAATTNSPNAFFTEATTLAVGSISGTYGGAIEGIIRVAGTGGNVALQWAQNTATVEDTKLLKDSFINLYALA